MTPPPGSAGDGDGPNNQTSINRALLLIAGLIAQLLLWLFTTHIQSRFLLPLLVPGAALIGVAATATPQRGKPSSPHHLVLAALTAAALLQSAVAINIFAHERSGHPNALLILGSRPFTGEGYNPSDPPQERAAALESLAPSGYCNAVVPADTTLYILGDSTPLYFQGRILYHTTWDRSPIGDLFRRHGDDTAAVAMNLRASGVGYILLNDAELNRLHRTGWYDPAATPQAVRALLARHATLVHAWPQAATALYRLNPPSHP